MHAYEQGEYRGTKMFVTPDNKTGFVVKSDSDIASAFSRAKADKAGDSILALAVQQGGRKLDAFDTVLPRIYSRNGFRAVSRLKWDDSQKPAGWDYDTFKKFKDGRPDVVFMVYDPEHAKPYKPGDGKLYKTYDEAVAAQADALKEIEGARMHPGEGYSKSSYVDSKGVIHTSNVYDAQRALFENRKVELAQLKQVSTLIKRLGETAAEMAEHGETAPVFNLCNVSVKGTNLFCAETKGIPRVEMPVIARTQTKDFIKHLKKLGYEVEKGNERAANLRATQNEISGTKVAAAVEKIEKQGFYKRLVISRDDYILDGHHTWAGQLAIDAKDNNLDDEKSVKIARVDISITKLIEEADKWTGGAGKKPASEAPKMFRQMTMAEASIVLPPALFRKYYMAACKFFDANAHIPRAVMNDLVVVVRLAPLYVHRDLQNVEAFTAWATAQGFDEVNDDLHVTVLYSKAAVDWDDMGDRETDTLVVPAGGERTIEVLGDDAVALVFASTALARRHGEMLGDGASSDYDAYVPHLTINLSGSIPDGAVPYDGELVFGPEIFETIDKDKDFDPDKHPRVPAGSSGGGEFTSGGGGETSADDASLDPTVVQVGGDEWNRATARRLERDYQKVKPELDKLANGAVKEGELQDELGAPFSSLSHADQLAVFNEWRKQNKIDDYDEAKEAWDQLSDAEKAKIAAEQGVTMYPEADVEEEDENAPHYPESWEEIGDSKQEEIFEAWKEAEHQKFLDDEQQSWYDNGQALADAKNQVAYDFSKDLSSKDREWAVAALDDLQGEHIDDGKPLPFSTAQILDSMEIEYEDNHGDGSDDPDMGFDDTKLDQLTPLGIDPAQQDLPGMEAPAPSERLTQEMRDEITKVLTKAFNYEAEHKQMDPPEYLNDNVNEYMDQYWGEMSDKDKFKWAYDNDQVDKPESESSDTPSNPVNPWKVEALPSKYDPLNETTGADYVRTQRLARYLSIMRARELIHDRLNRDTYPPKERVAAIDNSLWTAWKGSSTSMDGQLLQVASAEELGGRLNAKTATGIDIDGVKTFAEHRYADIGGYKGVLAYMRAKWETTQYLLDKGGHNELPLYRGIDLERHNKDRFEQAVREKGVKQLVTINTPEATGLKFEKAPTIKVDRNGAASMTTDFKVANGWMENLPGKVTLRAVVPRTAAISIPAYGINVHSEHEVVVAGTAWKAWDAWLKRAPTFEQVAMGAKGTGIGTSAPVQQAA